MSQHNRTIRCSMLPSYGDCPRRTAAKQFRRDLEAAGFELRQTRPSVGAAAGTAVHAVAAEVLQVKIDTGELGQLNPALDQAMVGFDEEIAEGCEWDATTGNRDTAQKQILRMARTYYHGVASKLDPLAVELAVKATVGEGWEVSGHIDLVTTDGQVRDLKTGALLRPYLHQLGGYSLLVRSCRIVEKVSGIGIDFIKRSAAGKPQAEPVAMNYPVVVAEAEAWATIGRIRQDMGQFLDGGDPRVFPANPMSMMCSERYCPVWGTDFCEMTKGRL